MISKRLMLQVLASRYADDAPIYKIRYLPSVSPATPYGVQHMRFAGEEKPHHNPQDGKNYDGVPKGLKQLLWELKLLVPKMVRSIPELKPQELSMEHVRSVRARYPNLILILWLVGRF